MHSNVIVCLGEGRGGQGQVEERETHREKEEVKWVKTEASQLALSNWYMAPTVVYTSYDYGN
jgi:hypothetical protein